MQGRIGEPQRSARRSARWVGAGDERVCLLDQTRRSGPPRGARSWAPGLCDRAAKPRSVQQKSSGWQTEHCVKMMILWLRSWIQDESGEQLQL